MKKNMKAFESYISDSLLPDKAVSNIDKERILSEYIHILQHERLVHLTVLIVTLLVFIMSVVLVITLPSLLSGLLFGILFLLSGGYLFHYYYLENHVQQFYLVYLDFIINKEEKKHLP